MVADSTISSNRISLPRITTMGRELEDTEPDYMAYYTSYEMARDQIERLTRQRDSFEHQVDLKNEGLREQRREIERQQSLLQAAYRAGTEVAAERDRLNGACESYRIDRDRLALENERLRGEAEVADEQLAQLRGFSEEHRNCAGSAPETKAQSVNGWTYDDGSSFKLTGCAGGAHPAGEYSFVTCEHVAPDGTLTVHEYMRTSTRVVGSSVVETSPDECDHPRSELLARKGDAFEMRKCLECTKIFRVRLSQNGKGD